MSNETRTMFVVLAVCGFLMCGCIVLPIGVGAMFFLGVSRQAEVAQAQAQQAMAAEQQARAQARAQAELARAQAQAAAPIAVPGMPPIPAPPVPTPPTLVLPGLAAPNLADIEQRKALYTAFKGLRQTEEELKKAGADDPTVGPTVGLIAEAVKQQQETLLKGAGITREQIDAILAEGDKAGW
jgi:hypothetical protein